MRIYITFGQDHRHVVNGTVFDNNSIAVIEAEDEGAGRERAVELFGSKWCTSYTADRWNHNHDYLFPRGFIHVIDETVTDKVVSVQTEDKPM